MKEHLEVELDADGNVVAERLQGAQRAEVALTGVPAPHGPAAQQEDAQAASGHPVATCGVCGAMIVNPTDHTCDGIAP